MPDRNRPTALEQAQYLVDEYQHTGLLPLLELATRLFNEALAATPPGHPDRARRLTDVAIALGMLFDHSGDVAVLRAAVKAGREAVALALSTLDSSLRHCASNLGVSLRNLYLTTKDPQTLDEAVRIARLCVEFTPEHHPNRAREINSLNFLLEKQAGEVDSDESMRETEAVRAAHETVNRNPSDDVRGVEVLHVLSGSLQDRFAVTGDSQLLQDAVIYGRKAVAATATSDPSLAKRCATLAAALFSLHSQTGDLELIHEAIEADRKAVALTPSGPERPLYLHNLGSALIRLFQQRSHPDLLKEALRLARESVSLTPRTGDPNRALYLTLLGGAARLCYDSDGEVAHLDEAIQAEREAVAITSDRDPRRAMYLNNLATAYEALYGRTRRREILKQAIDYMQQAVDLTPPNHPDRAGRLANLATLLDMSHDDTKQVSAVMKAVKFARNALEHTPEDHPDYAQRASTLAGALLTAFKNAGTVTVRELAFSDTTESPLVFALRRLMGSIEMLNPDVLTEAVALARKAVSLIPAGHPNRAMYLYNLAVVLETLAEHQESAREDALGQARDAYREAADDQAAATFVRIRAYRSFALLCTDAQHADAGLAAIEDAIDLVDVLAPGSLALPDREHQVSRISGLPGEAAAAALNAGRPDRAVELLERVRGVLVADVLGLRGHDQKRLRDYDHTLADQLDRIRERLDLLDRGDVEAAAATSDSDMLQPTRDPDLRVAKERREAYAEWRRLVERVRAICGFENFLRAPRIEQLVPQAQDGPLIYVSSSTSRSDALILTGSATEPVQAVSLPSLNQKEALQHAQDFVVSCNRATNPAHDPKRRMAAQREVGETLVWVWDVVCEPVLRHLGHTGPPGEGEEWPRIWWCPVGVLAFLPLHAAGRSTDDGVLDRVVSSYVTTVRALEHARSSQPAAEDPGLLIVPDSDLPGMTAETAAIVATVPGARLLEQPTCRTVLDALPRHAMSECQHDVAGQGTGVIGFAGVHPVRRRVSAV
ncbi:hypothetical protein [Catenulispora pinisilvae]|uniref:hypothetical protein n=1 Tax=Catenulispora pinisilvae TaxID=2705253 RepID=UPI0018926A14|nr:hypothetical protein [Catenulispora pinisilvae]